MIEWWVMKVIATKAEVEARELQGDPVIARWNALLLSGDLCYSGTELCEPVALLEGKEQQEAGLIRCQREHARTGVVHKLVLNADPEDLKG